jgi:erythromycin esterase
MAARTITSTLKKDEAITYIQERSLPLRSPDDLDPLMDRIGNARIVMLGEASHGTHEYYSWRSHITKRLIKEKGFDFVAVEGDWPDCYKLNRYIKGYTKDKHAQDVLHQFDRWPTWMWANWEIVALAEWMRQHNSGKPGDRKAGFYGLDVYSLWESMDAIMKYLKKTDPQALEVAEKAFKCFEPYRGGEGWSYTNALRLVPELCETEVTNMLTEIHKKVPQYDSDMENVFSTEQNALVAVNAERYYRAMLAGGPDSWNVRDSHMEETLKRLLEFHGPKSKAIVWEHNTHIGDASATDMAEEGMFNIGELARRQYNAEDVVLVGFGSYEGTVIAGKNWGDEMRVMMVPQGHNESWEFMCHAASPENKLMIMDDFHAEPLFNRPIGHRAIGVVYRPEYEHLGNYVPSIMPLRYDAFIYIDRTKALHPIKIHPNGHLVPDTYPFGI